MSNTCKKQKTIYNKQKNTPQYIASDCYGSVMLGTNKKERTRGILIPTS